MQDIKKTKIAVSILDSDFLNLESEIKKIESFYVDCLHLDIMDGDFVRQISSGQPIIKLIRKSTPLFLDAHLMIKNTDTALDSFIACGLDMITIHAESAKHLHFCLKKIKENKMKSCVALKHSTPLCFIENVLDFIDAVLIMSVDTGAERKNS